MNILGLIVEYNPFHNGHLYHLEQSKKLSGADYVICVMSGNFIQRGEPAIVNKWARTRMALLAGVDLVLEIPFVYSVASAEFFSFGAVKILDSLNVVDHICFGSEVGNIEDLDYIAGILHNEPYEYKTLLHKFLELGLSFPKARQEALCEYAKVYSYPNFDIGSVIRSSNNILGIEYLKALKKLKSTITPLTIKRMDNSYNYKHLTGTVSSATSIRNYIKQNLNSPDHGVMSQIMPKTSLDILHDEFSQKKGPIFNEDFENIILASLRKFSAKSLKSINYVKEGLENRIKHAALVSGSFDELIENISTKRYTKTGIQRIILNMLMDVTNQDFEMFNRYGGPQYARILGFNEKGKNILSKVNKNSVIPLISKITKFKNCCNPLIGRMLGIEALASDIYVLGYKDSILRKSGQEFTQNIIRI